MAQRLEQPHRELERLLLDLLAPIRTSPLKRQQKDTDKTNNMGGKGARPNFVDILTDPRQVAWMWEGTVESGIPPKDHATQINTLGLYIRGKKTYNPQKQVNFY